MVKKNKIWSISILTLIYFLVCLLSFQNKFWIFNKSNTKITTGKIVEKFEFTPDGAKQFLIKVNFKDLNKVSRFFEYNGYVNIYIPDEVGDNIQIIYNTRNPSIATIDSFWLIYQDFIFYFIIYLAMLLGIVKRSMMLE